MIEKCTVCKSTEHIVASEWLLPDIHCAACAPCLALYDVLFEFDAAGREEFRLNFWEQAALDAGFPPGTGIARANAETVNIRARAFLTNAEPQGHA